MTTPLLTTAQCYLVWVANTKQLVSTDGVFSRSLTSFSETVAPTNDFMKYFVNKTMEIF